MSCPLCFAAHSESVTCEAAYSAGADDNTPRVANVSRVSVPRGVSVSFPRAVMSNDPSFAVAGVGGEVPAALRPGMTVRGVWGQGCGEADGVVVEVVGRGTPRRAYCGGGFGSALQLSETVTPWRVRVVWENGRETLEDKSPSDTFADYLANRRGVGVYLLEREASGDWRTRAAEWKAEAARVKAAEEVKAATERARVAELCAAWDLEYPAAKRLPNARGGGRGECRFQPIDGGEGVRVWDDGARAKEYRAGDTIRHGGYNFDYVGKFVRATAGMAFYTEHGEAKRMTAERFCSENLSFDPVRSAEERSQWTD